MALRDREERLGYTAQGGKEWHRRDREERNSIVGTGRNVEERNGIVGTVRKGLA